MAATRYLITGGSGQLARDLAKLLPASLAPSRARLSITDPDRVRTEIARSGAEIVFNCAAYNAVDRAEQEREEAAAVNTDGAANVARACREAGARMVHFSTNYVFDGRAHRPYVETDEPHPLGAYGRSKLEGELRVLEALPTALVIRSSGLFGLGGSAIKGGSFPDRLLARARTGDPLAVVRDQMLNPTYTGHLAEASIAAAAAGSSGILHLVAAGCCSYHEFAVEVLRLAGIDVEIEPKVTDPPSGGAERPLNGCLRSLRADPLPSWRQGLRDYWQSRSVTVA